VTTRRSPLILVSLLLSSFLITVDTTIVNVALPTLIREMHASDSQLQWIVDAYNLVFASLLLAAGGLSDRVGRKGMLLAGLGLFGLASAVGGVTANPGQLIAARCVMGAGAAMVFPSTLSIISNVYTERIERARAIGLWGATAGMAIALGPIMGGALLEIFSWRSIFFALTPIALLAFGLVAVNVPTSRDPNPQKADRVGFVLATAAMGVLVSSIIEAPNYGWASTRSIVAFAIAAVLLVAFIAWERHVEEPMLDVSLFSNPRFTAACGSVTVAFFTLFGFIFLVTQYFQFVRSYSPLSTGLHTLPNAISLGVGSVFGTRLAMRFGTKLIVTLGLLGVVCFYGWASTVQASTSYLTLAVQMVIFGIGMGFATTPATEAVMGVVPEDKAGVGSAINDTTRMVGGALGVAVIGSAYATIYTNRVSARIPVLLPHHLIEISRSSIGGAMAVAKGLNKDGWVELGGPVHRLALSAFHDGLSTGCLLAGALALVCAVMVALWLPAHPERTEQDLADALPPISIPAHSGEMVSPMG